MCGTDLVVDFDDFDRNQHPRRLNLDQQIFMVIFDQFVDTVPVG